MQNSEGSGDPYAAVVDAQAGESVALGEAQPA